MTHGLSFEKLQWAYSPCVSPVKSCIKRWLLPLSPNQPFYAIREAVTVPCVHWSKRGRRLGSCLDESCSSETRNNEQLNCLLERPLWTLKTLGIKALFHTPGWWRGGWLPPPHHKNPAPALSPAASGLRSLSFLRLGRKKSWLRPWVRTCAYRLQGCLQLTLSCGAGNLPSGSSGPNTHPSIDLTLFWAKILTTTRTDCLHR